MLSTIFLYFADKDMKAAYEREKISFYSKVMPVITITIALLLIGCEILIRVYKNTTLTYVTEIVNGVALILAILFLVLTRYFHVASWFICPLLTVYFFYYIAFVSYDAVNVSLFYTLCIGITVSFFLLVIFTETWLMSTGVYAPLVTYFMWKTG